jgi:RNA polymerase sigma-70 factor (ECF subfamily)
MREREDTFRRWFQEHRGIVFKVTRAYAWTAEDREDLSQEIFCQLWRSIPLYRGESRESVWIYRVSLNTAMTWRRKAPAASDTPEPFESLPCPKPEPDAAASHRELLDWLYAEIAQLPKVDRSLIVLYLDGFSYTEMAQILGISESNVGVKLNRLKKRLGERKTEVSHGL